MAQDPGEPFLPATLESVVLVGMPFTQLGCAPGDEPEEVEDEEAPEEEEAGGEGGATEEGGEAASSKLKRWAASELCFKSVELLLSALEACGVDNARIEVEGGYELPVLDGSCLGWALSIQQAGLRPAPRKGQGDPQQGGALTGKLVMRPMEVITVSGVQLGG